MSSSWIFLTIFFFLPRRCSFYRWCLVYAIYIEEVLQRKSKLNKLLINAISNCSSLFASNLDEIAYFMAIVLANKALDRKMKFVCTEKTCLIENHFIGELVKRLMTFHNRRLKNFQRGINFQKEGLYKSRRIESRIKKGLKMAAKLLDSYTTKRVMIFYIKFLMRIFLVNFFYWTFFNISIVSKMLLPC